MRALWTIQLAGESKRLSLAWGLTINMANRVAIVCSVIVRIFNPMQVLGGHISALSNKDTCDLFCVVNNTCCQLLSCIIVQFIVHLLFDSHAVFIQWDYFVQFDFIVHFSCSPSKYSVLILDCIPGISIPLNIIIKQVNKYHTADFVLVWERVSYYHHRHRRDIQN
jgi:hypothetical protein